MARAAVGLVEEELHAPEGRFGQGVLLAGLVAVVRARCLPGESIVCSIRGQAPCRRFSAVACPRPERCPGTAAGSRRCGSAGFPVRPAKATPFRWGSGMGAMPPVPSRTAGAAVPEQEVLVVHIDDGRVHGCGCRPAPRPRPWRRTGLPLLQPLAGSWQEAQERLLSAESRLSKKSSFAQVQLAPSVRGLSLWESLSAGRPFGDGSRR